MKRKQYILLLLLYCASLSFTQVFAQPTIIGFTPTNAPVGSLVTITGTNLSNPTAISIAGKAAIPISNNGTTVVAMVMPGASSGSVNIYTSNDSAKSTDFFTVSNLESKKVQQGNKLVGIDTIGAANQGWSVAVSADGNTAIVGGYNDNAGAGAAWIYSRNSGIWAPQGAKLVGNGATGKAQQGRSVAISADGNTVLIGGNLDSNYIGASWVFIRNGNTWTQQGKKLVGTGSVGIAQQGQSVSLSADGSTAIIGGNSDNNTIGAAWVFARNGATWVQQGNKLIGTGAAGNAQQGQSVCISADGNTAIVGGNGDSSNVGAAWIFVKTLGGWAQQGNKLVGTGGSANARQGWSVAINADGNTAIIGGIYDNNFSGAVWVFTRTGTNWLQQGAKLIGSGSLGVAQQGYSLSLSADGNTALVGGFGDNGSIGAAWIFTRNGLGTWSQQGNKFVGTGSVGAANQGQSVALSADGNTAIVSGHADNGNAGAAWVYAFVPPPIITSISPETGSVGSLVTILGSNFFSPLTVSIGGKAAILISNNESKIVAMVMPGAISGAITITTTGGTPSIAGSINIIPTQAPKSQQGNKLIGSGSIGNAQQGLSVAISADGNTAIVGGSADNNEVGAAWIYTRSKAVWTQQGNKLVGDTIGSRGIIQSSQGQSVAISADGNTAIVGGYNDNGGVGAAWVYTRNQLGEWIQQGKKLVGKGVLAATTRLGYAVALSADGNTAIVGGSGDSSGVGAVWVFTRGNGSWTQQGDKLVGTGGSKDARQGYAVSLSADGNTILVGGYNDNGGAGAAWVFTKTTNGWLQQGNKLVGTGAIGNASQGFTVSLNADGTTAMVGGYLDNVGVGAAWVYTRNSNGVWSQQGNKLVATGFIGIPSLGRSVSLSADGNTAMVGGYGDNGNAGAAWFFSRKENTWTQQGDKLVGTGGSSDARQGFAGSMSADGFTAILGGYLDNNQTGAVWMFTYSPPPTINNFSPKSGPIGTLITITGNNLLSPSTINIGGIAAIPISNDGNSLVVMAMPGTSTGSVNLVTIGGSATSIGSFSVTSIQAPNIQQGNKLISADATIGKEQLGYSAAISADGNTAIVGGSNDNGGMGAAWIFSRTAGTWMQQGNKLIGSGATGNAQQGQSVAISADGNTAIVGGYNDNNGIGATWVFIRTASGWIQQGSKLVGTGAAGAAAQGYSVAISADGNKAIIGGINDNAGTGAAWIFTRSNGVWSQLNNKLVGTVSTADAKQGKSVAISADGKTALVGGYLDNAGVGAAWVFIDTAGSWMQQRKLINDSTIGKANQGTAVWLNADGNTAIVGGSADNDGVGAAWVYGRSGGNWTLQKKLIGSGLVGKPNYGQTVSVSADGNMAIIGGNTDNGGVGAAWVFSKTGGIWAQQGNKLFGKGSVGSANQGQSVALSADGITAIVGGHLDNAQAGAAWVYTYVSPPIINSFSPSSGPIGSLITITGTHLLNATSIKIGGVDALPISNDGNTLVIMVMPRTVSGVITIETVAGAVDAGNFTVSATRAPNEQQGNKLIGTSGVGSTQQGYSVAVSADGNTAIVGGYSDNNFAGAAWIFSRTGGVWAQQGGKLIGTEGSTTAQQGWSVAINADGNTAIVGGYNDKGGVGAAWVFTRSGGVWAQQGNKLVGTGIEGLGNAQQGQSVSLSADGNTAMVGGSGDNFLTGAAWVFTRNNGVWMQQGNKLVGTGSIGNARQGQSVSISANGRTAIVGGHNDNGGVGAAWVYTLSAGTWTQQGNKLIATGAVGNAQQGFSVAINADGTTAIVGGQADAAGIGAAWVYNRGGGSWMQQMKLVGIDTVGRSAQGQSVSISADGNTAMVGGSGDKNNAGAAWVFTRSNSTWTQSGNKLFGTGAIGNARQGFAISLSADGNTAISGGYADNNNIGASWAYYFNPPSSITAATYNASNAILEVTGINFIATPGSLNDIEVAQLSITGEGNSTYNLTSSNVEITNASSFIVKLNTTDSAAVNQILNKNGASSTDATVYNLTANNFWMTGSLAGNADLNDNPIVVTNVSVPSITSATYNIVTGLLSVKATGLLKRSGASNDIDVTKLTITGQGGSKVTLTTNTANVEISDATSFTLSLGAADKNLVNTLLNRSGNSSIDGTIYNLSAADDWNTGADPAINIADTINNAISVSGLPEIVTIVPLSATSISMVYGTASGIIGFSVAGSFLQAGILVTSPTGYEVSLDTSAYSNTITVGAAGNILSTKVFVRLKTGLSVGTYAGNIILSSINAPNIILATITGTVTPKELTISGVIANNKAFDGNANATLSGIPMLNGVLNTDTANIRVGGVPVATFSRSAIGVNLTVTVVGYTLTGSAANNYTVKLPIELKANIFDADVSIMPNPFFSDLTIQLNVAATSTTSTTSVRLLGLNGRVFKSVTVARGVNRIVLYGAELLPGVYLLEIKNNRYQQTKLVYKY